MVLQSHKSIWEKKKKKICENGGAVWYKLLAGQCVALAMAQHAEAQWLLPVRQHEHECVMRECECVNVHVSARVARVCL